MGVGRDAYLCRYDTTWKQIVAAQDVTPSLEPTEIEAACRERAWRENVEGHKKLSIEFNLLWGNSDGGFDALRTAFFARTPIKLAFVPSGSSNGMTGWFYVQRLSIGQPIGDVVGVGCTVLPAIYYSGGSLVEPSWEAVSPDSYTEQASGAKGGLDCKLYIGSNELTLVQDATLDLEANVVEAPSRASRFMLHNVGGMSATVTASTLWYSSDTVLSDLWDAARADPPETRVVKFADGDITTAGTQYFQADMLVNRHGFPEPLKDNELVDLSFVLGKQTAPTSTPSWTTVT